MTTCMELTANRIVATSSSATDYLPVRADGAARAAALLAEPI